MAFYGKGFMFNSIPGETYGLYLTNFDTGMINSPAGSDIEIFEVTPYRRSKPYYLGVQQTPILEFPVVFTTPEFLDGPTRSAAKRWLFGSTQQKAFQVMECDISDVVFTGHLVNAQDIYAGNLCRGFSATMRCNAPWGFTFPQTTTKNYTSGGIESETFNLYNSSDDSDYLYPSMTFTMNGIGTSFTLVNNTDASRSFAFTDISALEVMTVDNDRQIVSSSTGLTRLGKFNKNWLRLLPGNNSLTLTGGITQLTLTYSFARKVGG